MKSIHLNLYRFGELSAFAKDEALNKYRFINVEDTWWDSIYEDAERSGLKITGFEFESGYYCNARFVHDAIHCAGEIMDNHGDATPTYAIALSFWAKRNQLVRNWPKDENGEFMQQDDLDNELDRIEDAFLTHLQWAYHSLLIEEYNYQTADEAVTATFEAQDFHFTADGKMANRLEKLIKTQI